MNVGVLGAWSIDNAGDALIGLATRRALRSRLPAANVIAFAPRFPGDRWRHQTDEAHGMDGPIQLVPCDDLSWTRELDALVIGGGGIVNFAPAFRAFLLDAPGLADLPIAWNGVCSQNTPAYAASAEDRLRVRTCCERLAYASVRNATTLSFVRTCGVTNAVHVVPDAAFGDLGVTRRPRAAGFTIGLSLGNAIDDARAAGYYRALFSDLASLVSARDAELRLIAFGGIYSDAALLERAKPQLPPARVVELSSPLDRWTAIGDVDVYIGARLHSIIAAIAQDVPFVAADEYFSDQMASSKVRELLVELGMEAHYTCPFVTRTPGPKLAHAARIAGTSPFATIVTAVRDRLETHWTAMIRALGLPC